MNKIIIDGVDVSECLFRVTNPNMTALKHQINMCKNHICDIGYSPYCEYNSNCYFKQLQRLKSEFSEVLDAKCGTIVALKVENDELKKEIMVLRNGYDEEDCTLTCPSLQAYKQSDEEGQEIIAELKAENDELKKLLEEQGKIIDCKTGTIQSLAKIRDELKAEIKELRDSLMKAEAIIITYKLKDENKND